MIAQLEQPLEIEKTNVNKKSTEQIVQLQQSMEVLRITHEANIATNNMKIQEFQETMVKYKDVPTIDELIKEASKLNSILSKQQDLFCQEMSHITPYLNTIDQLTDKEIDQRTEFNGSNTKIYDYIE